MISILVRALRRPSLLGRTRVGILSRIVLTIDFYFASKMFSSFVRLIFTSGYILNVLPAFLAFFFDPFPFNLTISLVLVVFVLIPQLSWALRGGRMRFGTSSIDSIWIISITSSTYVC